MITKNIITDSSFKNNLNINSVDGRKKYKGLPDSVAEKIKELARDGAKKNEYMLDDFRNYYKSVKLKYASPNFSQVKSTALSTMNYYMNRRYTGDIFADIWGYGAKFTMNYDNTPLIDIYEGDTAVISYDAKNGGWRRSGMTKDEKAFDRDVTNLYPAEYRKTKEEMKNSQITTKTEISINISKTQSFSMSV